MKGIVEALGRTRAARRLGPVLMTAGFLAAALGGLTASDCFLCTVPELISGFVGALLILVGSLAWQLRRSTPPGRRLVAVVVVTVLLSYAALAARLLVSGMVIGGI